MYEEAAGECERLIEMCELFSGKYDDYLKIAHKKKKEIADIDFTHEMQVDEDSAKLAREAAEVNDLWQKMEASKMAMQNGSAWFVLSLSWYSEWKAYVDFFGGLKAKRRKSDLNERDQPEYEENMDDGPPDFPGPILNAELLDYEAMSNLKKCAETERDIASMILRQNLREEEHFTIVSEEVWNYLFRVYGGTPVKRFARLREENSEECFIELYFRPVQIFFVPRTKDLNLEKPYTLYVSRKDSVQTLRHKIIDTFSISPRFTNFRLWKLLDNEPDMMKAYSAYVSQLNRTGMITINATVLKIELTIEEINLAETDIIIVEVQTDGRYLIETKEGA